ncbi:MAG: hypothetical protein LJE84_05765 [Gammaproteobacteria bacterium]|nr:hypothetical protein [Gammaproteobacteria bacterium]
MTCARRRLKRLVGVLALSAMFGIAQELAGAHKILANYHPGHACSVCLVAHATALPSASAASPAPVPPQFVALPAQPRPASVAGIPARARSPPA